MKINNSNSTLIIFLRELADSIENNTISEENLKYIGEFCMSYMFYNNSIKIEQHNYDKFTILGWYMYTFLLNKT